MEAARETMREGVKRGDGYPEALDLILVCEYGRDRLSTLRSPRIPFSNLFSQWTNFCSYDP